MMNRKNVITLLLIFVFILATGCKAKGPSSKAVQELIYGTYFRKAEIIKKEQCQPLQGSDNSEFWLVVFQYENDDNQYGWLIEMPEDGSLYPVGMPTSIIACPN